MVAAFNLVNEQEMRQFALFFSVVFALLGLSLIQGPVEGPTLQHFGRVT